MLKVDQTKELNLKNVIVPRTTSDQLKTILTGTSQEKEGSITLFKNMATGELDLSRKEVSGNRQVIDKITGKAKNLLELIKNHDSAYQADIRKRVLGSNEKKAEILRLIFEQKITQDAVSHKITFNKQVIQIAIPIFTEKAKLNFTKDELAILGKIADFTFKQGQDYDVEKTQLLQLFLFRHTRSATRSLLRDAITKSHQPLELDMTEWNRFIRTVSEKSVQGDELDLAAINRILEYPKQSFLQLRIATSNELRKLVCSPKRYRWPVSSHEHVVTVVLSDKVKNDLITLGNRIPKATRFERLMRDYELGKPLVDKKVAGKLVSDIFTKFIASDATGVFDSEHGLESLYTLLTSGHEQGYYPDPRYLAELPMPLKDVILAGEIYDGRRVAGLPQKQTDLIESLKHVYDSDTSVYDQATRNLIDIVNVGFGHGLDKTNDLSDEYQTFFQQTFGQSLFEACQNIIKNIDHQPVNEERSPDFEQLSH